MNYVFTQEEIEILLALGEEQSKAEALNIEEEPVIVDKETPVEITYEPEYSDMAECPACGKEFDFSKVDKEKARCPHCGQKLKVDIWIS